MLKLLISGAAAASLIAAAYGMQQAELACGKPPAQADTKAATIKAIQVDEQHRSLGFLQP